MFKKIKNMSTLWIFVIIIGATLVTLGNFQYIKAREKENKKEMADQVLAILIPELQRNEFELIGIKTAMEKEGYYLTTSLEKEAWDTVAKTNLLSGLKSENLSELIQLYYLINKSNNIQTQIADTLTGLNSTLNNVDNTRQILINEYKMNIEKSQEILKSILKNKKINNRLYKSTHP